MRRAWRRSGRFQVVNFVMNTLSNYSGRQFVIKLLFAIGISVSISILQWIFLKYFPAWYELSGHLYYLPIFFAAYHSGVLGAILTGFIVVVLLGIHTAIYGVFGFDEAVGQSLIFLLFGVVTGYYTDKIHKSNLLQMKLRMDFFKGLSNVLDSRDTYTEGHSYRVSNIARLIGSKMNLSRLELDHLYQAGLLHDIGKIGIPDKILKKEGRLDEKEYAEIKRHSLIAHSIMKEIDAFKEIRLAIRHHHEWYDGGGYPDGLQGGEIPLYSRIISVADTLDALTSRRSYNRRKSIPEALEIIQAQAGTQFDPEIVDVVLSIPDSLKSLSEEAGIFYLDPVCKMKVNPETSSYVYQKNHHAYYFCSRECYDIFVKEL